MAVTFKVYAGKQEVFRYRIFDGLVRSEAQIGAIADSLVDRFERADRVIASQDADEFDFEFEYDEDQEDRFHD